MSALEDLVTKLTSDGAIELSEGFGGRLNGWVSSAIARHNAIYTPDTLPASDYEAVTLLAMISLCYARASKYANSPNMAGGHGYGTDRNTPYFKNMDLAKNLQDRYDTLVQTTDEPSSGGIHQSELVIKSDRTDAIESPQVSPVLSVLSKGVVNATSAVLEWISTYRSDFADAYIYYSLTSPIREAWRINTDDGVPGISASAERIARIQDQDVKSVKLEGLTPSSTYYFLLVTNTRAGRFYYSNELAVLTPAS